MSSVSKLSNNLKYLDINSECISDDIDYNNYPNLKNIVLYHKKYKEVNLNVGDKKITLLHL